MNKYEAIVPNPNLSDFRDPSVAIGEAFTWDRGIEETGSDGLYVVQFWSARDDVSPEVAQALIDHDQAAYGEAMEAFPGKFLKYYCDASPTNISKSMCLWTSPEYARSALHLPAHQKAVRFMYESEVYDTYRVSGWILKKAGVGLTFAPVK